MGQKHLPMLQYRGLPYRLSVPLRVYPSAQEGCYRGRPVSFCTPMHHLRDLVTVTLRYRGAPYTTI